MLPLPLLFPAAVLLSARAASAASGAAFAPTHPGTNGLGATDLASASFPVAEGFVLHWVPSSAGAELPRLGAAPSAFVVELTGWLSAECGGGICKATPLTWSSGETKSSASSLTLPATLTSRFAAGATFEWKVRLHDGAAWSEWASSSFDTSPDAASWAASSWIGGGSELRADFELPAGKSVVRARAYATGVGAMELHLNGAKVGDHILDPGEAVYDQKVLFLSFNVTEQLKAGMNAVGARLGNSKFGYLDIYTNRTALGDQSGDSSRAFRLVLVAELSDGSTHTLVSSTKGWKSRHGPIVYDHLWHGETYDSRQELEGWSAKPLAGFPSGSWSPAKAMSPTAGRLYPQLMPPIRKIKDYPAISSKKLGPSSQIYDFGQNQAGLSTLTLDLGEVAAAHDGAASVTVMLRLKHTEIVHADGSSYNNYYPGMEFNHASPTCSMEDWYERKWYECANQTDGYIFVVPAATESGGEHAAASKPVEYSQSFTYHGFRHLELVATELLPGGGEGPLPAKLQAAFPWNAKVVAHQAHTDMTPLAKLELNGDKAESTMIAKIFNATIASHLSNVWSIPTDCPQREKRGWMGDAGISSSSLQTFFDAFAFHANFLRLLVDNQVKGCTDQPTTTINGPCKAPPGVQGPAKQWFNGSVPDVTPFPTSPYGANPGSTDWQTAFVVIARNALVHYGDLAKPLLSEIYPSLQLFMDDYLERLIKQGGKGTGLLLTGARGDWIPPDGNEKGPYPTTPTTIAAFWHTLCVGYMAEIATAIGRTADASRYTARLEANRKAYHKTFYNGLGGEDGGAMADPEGLSRCCYDTGSQTNNVFALQIGAVPPELINSTVAMLVASLKNRSASSPHGEQQLGASSSLSTTGTFDPKLPPHWIQGTGSDSDPKPIPTSPFGPGAHMDCGIFGTTYLFEVLHKYGHDAVGIDVLTETSYPSFGYMIEQGATTLWESWAGTRTEIGFSGTSRNHIMFGGGVNRFIAAAIGGLTVDTGPLVDPAAAGWRTLLVHPSPHAMRTLGSGGTSRQTPQGEASVAWRTHENTKAAVAGAPVAELDLVVPPGCTADVRLPLLDEYQASGDDVPRTRKIFVRECAIACEAGHRGLAATEGACEAYAGARCERRLDGEVVLSLQAASGAHSFAVL